MPFKSKAQQKYMFWAESKGKIPTGTAERWAKHTPNIKKLPEKKAVLSSIKNRLKVG
jgi:hypothetical protein